MWNPNFITESCWTEQDEILKNLVKHRYVNDQGLSGKISALLSNNSEFNDWTELSVHLFSIWMIDKTL